jgi:type IV pilus assembly protein PilA
VVDDSYMHSRTTARTAMARRSRDTGFTLIELLVVVIVIGLLAAIAIPVFLNQRKKGIDAGIKSDLRSVAHAVEAWNADNTTDRDGPAAAGTPLSNYTAGSDTLASTIALPGGSSVKTSPGNFVTIYANSTGNGYCVAAAHGGSSKGWTRPGQPTSTQASIYDSTAGGITSTPSSGCTLPGAPAADPYTNSTNAVACPHIASAVLISLGGGTYNMAATFSSSTMSPAGTSTFPQMWPQYSRYTTAFGGWNTASVVTGSEYRDNGWYTLAAGTHTFGVRAQQTTSTTQTAAQGCTQGVSFAVPASAANGARITGTITSTAPTP